MKTYKHSHRLIICAIIVFAVMAFTSMTALPAHAMSKQQNVSSSTAWTYCTTKQEGLFIVPFVTNIEIRTPICYNGKYVWGNGNVSCSSSGVADASFTWCGFFQYVGTWVGSGSNISLSWGVYHRNCYFNLEYNAYGNETGYQENC